MKKNDLPSKVVSSIIEDLKRREEKGVKEYGTTVDRNDYSMDQWLDELYEELLDAAVYVKKIRRFGRIDLDAIPEIDVKKFNEVFEKHYHESPVAMIRSEWEEE